MDFKKHIFWIVLAVVLLAGVAVYAVVVPDISAEGERVRGECEAKANKLEELARKSGQPDAIKTEKHVRLAKSYGEMLNGELANLKATWNNKKLDIRFDEAGKAKSATEFDNWLNNKRTELLETARAANLDLSKVNTEKLLFKEQTDDQASDETRHRAYRLRHLAITEEILRALCKKVAKQEVSIFRPEGDLEKKQVDVGALALEALTVQAPSGAEPAWLNDVYFARCGRSAPAAGAKVPRNYADLPYTYTPVEVQFVAPIAAVPQLLRALESSERYFAVIARLDFKRSVPPYPSSNDQRLATAGPNPWLNTHFQEGPVTVLVTLNLMEYDKSKEPKDAKVAAAPEK